MVRVMVKVNLSLRFGLGFRFVLGFRACGFGFEV